MTVSKETALLLKEKGYDVPCEAYFNSEKNSPIRYEDKQNYNRYSNACSVPPLHEVADWLRDVHKIHVAALPVNLWQQWRMFLYIDTMPPQKQRIPDTPHDFPTYLQTLEAGINHALKNYV